LYFEHAIYTSAICVLLGLVYETYTTRNPVWIVWFSMLIPDSDFVVQTVLHSINPYEPLLINHGDLHNFFFVFCIAVVGGWYIWKHTNISFGDGFFCISLGACLHMAEDALVNGTRYHFYRPFSERGWYQGFILEPWNDIVFANNVIASTNVIIIGVVLLVIAILIRGKLQGYKWIRKYNLLPAIYDVTQSLLDSADEYINRFNLQSDEYESEQDITKQG